MKNILAAGPAEPPRRAIALDALRGMAILAMLLASEEPFGENALPAWMYHAQERPPAHEWLATVPGITWVDRVFPTFLFCLGAAIPLALTRRLDQGVSKARVGLFIFGRGLLLGFFALYVMPIRPGVLSNHPAAGVWLLGLLGFCLLFPVLTRLPATWPNIIRWLVKAGGWAAALLFLAMAHYPDTRHPGFWLGRSDIIIVVLTNGCYRLHPVEWNIGETAGTLAAFCLARKCPPRGVRADAAKLADFQALLKKAGVPLGWPKDLPRG